MRKIRYLDEHGIDRTTEPMTEAQEVSFYQDVRKKGYNVIKVMTV